MTGYYITEEDFDGIWLWAETMIRTVGDTCEDGEFRPDDFKAEMLKSMRRTRVRVEDRLTQCEPMQDNQGSGILMTGTGKVIGPVSNITFSRGDIAEFVNRADDILFTENLEDPDWDELDE